MFFGQLIDVGEVMVRGLSRSSSGSPFKGMMAFTALDMATSLPGARRHHMLSTGAGVLSGQVGSALGGMLGAAVGGMIPIPGASIAGDFIGNYLGYEAGRRIEKPVQAIAEAARQIRHVNFGDQYFDTSQAYTMRQRAAQEMSGSLFNARRWLGQESFLLHQ